MRRGRGCWAYEDAGRSEQTADSWADRRGQRASGHLRPALCPPFCALFTATCEQECLPPILRSSFHPERPQLVPHLQAARRRRLPRACARPPRPRAWPARGRAVHARGLRRRRRCAGARAGLRSGHRGRLLDGGPVASLMARDHPDAVAALVLCATAREWKDPRMRALWGGMGVLRLVLGAFPHQSWRWGLRRARFPDSPITSWVAAELSRGSARDLAEAGRELGRFDSRTWIKQIRVPSAVVVTTRDSAVPPRKQYELAESLGAPTFEIDCDHSGVTVKGDEFCRVLLRALESVSERRGAA